MFELLKKTFTIKVLDEVIEYKQLSYYECLELHYLINEPWFNIVEWVYKFLKTKLDIKEKDLLNIDIQKFFEVYLNTGCRWFYNKVKNKKIKEDLDIMPFEAYISFIANQLCIDPIWLLKKYTAEAFEYVCDGVLYNLKEQTKEWKRANQLKKLREENKKEITTEDDLEQIKKAREHYKHLFTNK